MRSQRVAAQPEVMRILRTKFEKQLRILRLTTPELMKTFGAPFAQDDRHPGGVGRNIVIAQLIPVSLARETYRSNCGSFDSPPPKLCSKGQIALWGPLNCTWGPVRSGWQPAWRIWSDSR